MRTRRLDSDTVCSVPLCSWFCDARVNTTSPTFDGTSLHDFMSELCLKPQNTKPAEKIRIIQKNP